MKKSEGRDKCFALGTWILAKWVALWRKFFIKTRNTHPQMNCRQKLHDN